MVSVELAEYWTVETFCDALHSFLEAIGLSRVHVYAAGLGGFLAMNYVARRPERVASVVLTHSFLTTDSLQLGLRYSPGVLRWLPEFLVRAAMRDVYPAGASDDAQAAAVEFAIRSTARAPRAQLAARLALALAKSSVVGRHRLPEDRITLIDSMQRARERDVEIAFETARFLPGAKRALLKTGGDFPYISVADEVNMHIVVHLRRNAPVPTEFPKIPPPALLPEVWRHDRRTSSTSSAPEPVPESTEETDEPCSYVSDDHERRLIENYAPDIAKLREFLPDKQDNHLAAILADSGGSLDVAVSNVLENE